MSIYESFLKSLPYIYDTAAAITEAELQAAIITIVENNVPRNVVKDYVNSFNIHSITPEKRLVTFEPTTDIVKFMETGIKSFSIKAKTLQVGRPGVKTSKEGFLYKTIAINKEGVTETDRPSGTEKEEQVRERIQEVLKTAKFAFKAAFTQGRNGEHTVIEQADRFGLLKVSTYESKTAYQTNKKAKNINAVLFRTMSSKPGTSPWEHPGIQRKDLLRQVEEWQDANEDRIFNESIDEILGMLFP